MRLLNFLNEDINNLLKNNEIFELAKKNMFIYRGIKQKIKKSKIINRKKDREPKTTNIIFHNILDDLFNEKFGWKARSQGIFTTGEIYDAKGYGNPYIFIPIKPYSFLWSENILDLWFNLFSSTFSNIKILTRDEHKKFITLKDKDIDKYKDKNIDKDILRNVINSYTDKNIIKAIISGNEIMFNCDKYVLFNKDYFKNEIT